MITLRAALVSACVLAALSTLYSPELARAPRPGEPTRPAPSARGDAPAWDGTERPAARQEKEWSDSLDNTGLLDEWVDVDALVDELSADSGEGFEPIGRERLASVLLADPELRKHYVRAP